MAKLTLADLKRYRADYPNGPRKQEATPASSLIQDVLTLAANKVEERKTMTTAKTRSFERTYNDGDPRTFRQAKAIAAMTKALAVKEGVENPTGVFYGPEELTIGEARKMLDALGQKLGNAPRAAKPDSQAQAALKQATKAALLGK